MPAPEHPIRLIALDIDGTLVASASDQVVPPRTCAAVREAVARGVTVALVTGRMAVSAAPIVESLGLDAPLVAHHGAVIRLQRPGGPASVGRTPSGRTIRHTPLPPAAARAALAFAAAEGLLAHLNRLDQLIMQADDPRVALFEGVLGIRARLVRHLDDALEPAVTKVMIGSAGSSLDEDVLVRARARLGDVAAVTTSSARFVEVLAPGVSKGRGVRWLAARFGVPLGQALAIGDNVSDIEMLRAVGHPVAMPHAPAAVLEAAREVAPSLLAEGAAEIIERCVLAKLPAGSAR